MKRRVLVDIGLSLVVCATAAFAEQATSDSPSPPHSSSQASADTTKSQVRSKTGTSRKSLAASAWETLSEELCHKRTTHRSNAISALSTIGGRGDILPLLLGALNDKESSVRKDAVLALGNLHADSAKPQLRKMLDDSSADVGFTAAETLSKMGDHSGRAIFIATLQGDRKGDGVIKESLKSNLAKYRDPKVLAMTGAHEAAGALFGPFSMGLVVAEELLKDRGASARAKSATMLAQDPSPDAVEQLRASLYDKNWAVRASAAQALAKSPGKVSPNDFEELLADKNDSVRTIAAAGIIRRTGAARPKALRWPSASSAVAVTARAE